MNDAAIWTSSGWYWDGLLFRGNNWIFTGKCLSLVEIFRVWNVLASMRSFFRRDSLIGRRRPSFSNFLESVSRSIIVCSKE